MPYGAGDLDHALVELADFARIEPGRLSTKCRAGKITASSAMLIKTAA